MLLQYNFKSFTNVLKIYKLNVLNKSIYIQTRVCVLSFFHKHACFLDLLFCSRIVVNKNASNYSIHCSRRHHVKCDKVNDKKHAAVELLATVSTILDVQRSDFSKNQCITQTIVMYSEEIVTFFFQTYKKIKKISAL